jgi:class 3 adenylate cyclase
MGRRPKSILVAVTLSPRDPASALVPTIAFEHAGLAHIEAGVSGGWVGAALFLDVSGFTTLSEALGRLGSAGTEDLVRVLNGFFGPAIAEIRDAGGEVVAFGGDAITAVWGGAAAGEAAVSTAARLAAQTRDRSTIDTIAGTFELAVRIGVATGPLEVAIGGAGRRLVVLTHGEAVDAAVACEGRASPGQVLVDLDLVDDEDGSPAASSTPASDLEPDRFAHAVTVDRLRRGDTTLLDGHRQVTTVFASLPETDAHGAMEHVVRVTTSLGGEVIQVTGGDKGTVALLTFGAPTSSPDDATRAVAAAVRLVQALPTASAGVTSGMAFAGRIGDERRSVYTVIGDPVNLAARLMQAAEAGDVLVDAVTAAAAETAFRFEGWSEIVVKGKQDAVRVATVAGQRGSVWPANPLATDGPMLGRADELRRAEAVLADRPDGLRRLIVRGAPGIGKSRFARAVAGQAAARGWRVVAGGFAGLGEPVPYEGWHPVLRSALSGDASELEAALAARVPEAAGLAPLLAPLVGFILDDTERSAMFEGEHRHEVAADLAVRVLESAARETPLVIELEDWHWADASSERLLRALSRRTLDSAITLVVTQREPSEGATVAARPDDVVIDLRELGDDVVRDVAATVLARTGRGADPERLERIVTLGAGNPLMVETLVDVGDEGVLTTGLAPLLQARLDRLPDKELRPLLWASAFGRAVDPEELGAAMDLGGDAEPDLVQLLDGLVAAGMLAAARPADAGLGFRHASVREAAYERLSHVTRRRVHHSVARTLEERDGAPVEIAGHLLPTDDVERQRRWYPLAGSQARAAWAVVDAISWFERARDVGDASDQVRVDLAGLVMVRGDPDRAGDLLQEPCADPSFERRRLLLTGERSMVTGGGTTAVEVLTDALAAVRAEGTVAEEVAACELLSRALIEVGRLDEGAEIARSSIDRVDPADHDTMARAVGAYGTALIHRYDLAEAVPTLARAVAEAEAGEDRVRLVHLRSDLGMARAMSGDVAGALDAMLSAREVATTIGYERHLALSVSNEAELRLLLGDWDAVTVLSLRGLEAAVTLNDVGLACDDLLRLAAHPALAVDDRREIIDATIPVERRLGRPHTMIEFDVVALEIDVAGGTPIPSERFDHVLTGAEELDRPDLEIRVLEAWGSDAPLTAIEGLASGLDEDGDRFALDMVRRRLTGETAHDQDLRRRGLELYRSAPYARTAAALAELGITDPPTDARVAARTPEPDDPVYRLADLLATITRLG